MRNSGGSLRAVICLSLMGPTSLKGRHLFFFFFIGLLPTFCGGLINGLKWYAAQFKRSRRDQNALLFH